MDLDWGFPYNKTVYECGCLDVRKIQTLYLEPPNSSLILYPLLHSFTSCEICVASAHNVFGVPH